MIFSDEKIEHRIDYDRAEDVRLRENCIKSN